MQLYDTNEFRATKDWPYAISAGCVVYRLNGASAEVLLLVREPTHPSSRSSAVAHHLPKGHVNFGEALETAAMRETEEEAGVAAEITGYLGICFWNVHHPIHHISVQKTAHYFAASWSSDKGNIDNEHDGKVWISLDEAEKLLGEPNPKGEDEIIRRLKKFLELTNA